MKYLLGLSILILVVVVFGWYCSENYSGRINRNLEQMGYAIVSPGQIAASILSGNLHGGFGDWRNPAVKIGISFVIWFSPCALIFFLIRRNLQHRDDLGEKP
jgi:hypothetical protein